MTHDALARNGVVTAAGSPEPTFGGGGLLALSIGLYVPMYAGVTGFEIPSQLAAIGFVGSSSLLAGSRGFRSTKLGTLEWICYGICCLSLLVSLFEGDDYVALYTMTLSVLLVCISVLVRSTDLSDLFRAVFIAFWMMMGSTVVLAREALWLGLTAGADDRWSLRFTPLGMHPNLVGFVYGGGAVLFFSQACQASTRFRMLPLGASALCILFVVAASSRAGFLASGVAMLVSLLLAYKDFGAAARKACWLAAASLPILLIFKFDAVIGYLSTALELNSSTRGFESGASGRGDLWTMGVELIYDRGWKSMFGGGLRSASVDRIGFNTENSYIHIMLESGVFAGALLFAALGLQVLRLAAAVREGRGLPKRVLPLFIFMVIESFFNRYLFAIGNPLSLFFLILCLHVGLGEAGVRHNRQTGLAHA